MYCSRYISSYRRISIKRYAISYPIHPIPIVKYHPYTFANLTFSLPQFQAPELKTVPSTEWSYTHFMKEVKNKHIQSVDIHAKDLHTEALTYTGEEVNVQLIPTNTLIDDLMNYDVDVHYINEQVNDDMILGKMFEIFIQMIGLFFILRLIFILVSNQNGRGPFGVNQQVGKLYEEENKITVSFNDVAGIDNAKEDLKEIVEFLQDGDKYIEMGARIPKGILLIGPPGTGKTLLARAVAGEAGVPFFSCSASEFIELFVGLGASRIRELFKKTKEKAPCIIFIDEIDAIGKKRSAGMNSNDEREQTINQLLIEMDGFDPNSGVILIAATNRPELLDEALVRPGRFDRQVYVELPDFIGRKAILKVHLQNKKIDSSIDLDGISKMTIGFSGADLENLCNEAAIYAARENLICINQSTIITIFHKIILGAENKTKIVSDSKRELIAYHEAGHALIGLLLGDYDNIKKISIVPRGDSYGVTYFEPNEDHLDNGLYTRQYLENRLMVALGGRIAEELKYGTLKITTGASQDFRQATTLAIQMVTEYGFNQTIGPLNVMDNIVGEALSIDIASEVKELIDHSYRGGMELLRKNEFYLDRIAKALIEKENLELKDLNELLEGINCYTRVMSSYYDNETELYGECSSNN
uniref:AAA+ ATPase domain-containing protein n=1 Tax=viral metagenome TaxID=1070528 RepID=A0A6C0CUJ9_9ZZZZ